MICPQCNREIPDESVFCPNCGTGIVDKTADGNIIDEIKTPKKISIKKIAGCAAAAILLIAVIVGGSIYNSQPFVKYARAEKAFARQNYEKAIKYYTDAGDYEDAKEKLEIANRANNYQMGLAYMQSGNYSEAAEQFKASKSYEDADDKIIEMGQELVEAAEYENAMAIFECVKNGTKNAYARYAQGQIYFASQNYTKAANSFKSAGNILDAEALYNDAMYKDASNEFSKKNYTRAAALFKQISGYEDSDNLTNACNLMSAKEKIEEGNLNQALSELKNLPIDFSYNDVSVSELLTLLENNSKWISVCGKWTSTGGQMISRRNGSGEWSHDFEEGDLTIDVTCIPDTDGSVTVKIIGSMPVCTSYSIVSAGVRTKNVSLNVEQNMTALGTIKIDDDTSVTIGSDSIKANYKVVDRSRDVYFTYTYKTDVTFGKKTMDY